MKYNGTLDYSVYGSDLGLNREVPTSPEIIAILAKINATSAISTIDAKKEFGND